MHVLSSPRIATLNNQKAVIKVGTEEPFVTNIVPGYDQPLAGAPPWQVPPSLSYQPFFSGISLDVTPQIDERDRVTLHVHALVNSISERAEDFLAGCRGRSRCRWPSTASTRPTAW